ncbi:MAG: hypothetical protein ACHREM_23710 [Polyangiales bacterium]
MSDLRRLRGLRALLQEAVHHGSSAIERVHLETAKRTFTILEAIPPITEPTKIVHVVHDATVTSVYAAIRGVNAIVGKGLDVAIDVAETIDPKRPDDR